VSLGGGGSEQAGGTGGAGRPERAVGPGGGEDGALGRRLDAVAVRSHAELILDEVSRAVIGKRATLELVLAAMLADGHVLLEDNPGLAKTLIARSFAAASGLSFSRVQFTPDLMPADITGATVYHQPSGEFRFRCGPIFTNVLLADEINRAPPKTQAALLEAMQERQVTGEDRTRHLPRPFLVLATQNPIEFEGTYPLPEAQLDRFLARASVGYPEADVEQEMLLQRARRGEEEVRIRAVADRELLLAMQRAIEEVHVSNEIAAYIVELVRATRAHPSVQVGASPRGSLALLKLARACAAIAGRDFVTPDDVKQVALPALCHRLVLRAELWVQGISTVDVARECLAAVAVPPTQPGQGEALP
jgi:MoxR-like ATPase